MYWQLFSFFISNISVFLLTSGCCQFLCPPLPFSSHEKKPSGSVCTNLSSMIQREFTRGLGGTLLFFVRQLPRWSGVTRRYHGGRADVETPSNSPPLHQFVLPVNAFDAFPGPFAILSACRNFGQFCFHSMHQRPQFR